MTWLVLLLFFLSGVSGLVYQVIWVREFGTIFGATVFSAATVSAVFMLGLGLGSYWVGRWSDRLYARGRSAPLRAYGVFEITIALLGLAVALLLPHLEGLSAWLMSYRQDAAGWYELSFTSQLLRIAIAVGLLSPITLLMGGTLTLLIRYLVANELSLAGWRIGALYGINTAGAALGAFITDFALVPSLGIFATEGVAVALNAVAGTAALVLAARDKSVATRPPELRAASAAPAPISQLPLLGMAIALLCSGVAAMGMEIVWFRYLISSLRSLRAVFSLLLTVILVGICLGSLLGGWLERRTGRAAALYVGTQALFVLTSIAAFIFYDPRTMGLVDPVAIVSAAAHATGLSQSLLEVSFSLQKVILLAGIPAILMGCTFPLANAHVQRVEAQVGRQSGVLYLANTLGNVIGAAGTGLVLLPWLGAQRSALLLMGLVIVGLIALYAANPKDARNEAPHPVSLGLLLPCVALLSLAMLFWLRQPQTLLLLRTLPVYIVEQDAQHTLGGAKILALEEGINETVAVIDTPAARSLYTNGHSMSAVSNVAARYMRLFAHLPLLNIEQPKTSLVIGFGVGTTLHATSLYSSMERLDVAEISRNVLDHASYFSESNDNVLEDPRVHIHVNDGRQHLRMQPKSFYDLVTLEPPPIKFAGVASLYSREFYELVRSRLKEGGYLTQWLPGYQVSGESALSIVKAFVDVFPGAVLVSGYDRELILIGMKGGEAILDLEQIRRSLAAEPAVRQDLEAIKIHSLVDLVGTFAASYDTLQHATASARPVTDDDPIIEYDALMAGYDTRMPAELFDVNDVRVWCPGCYEGDQLREEFRRLEPLQKALSIYYASDSFLRLKMLPGQPWRPTPSRELKDLLWQDPCVTAALRESDYLSSIFRHALFGIPKRACE